MRTFSSHNGVRFVLTSLDVPGFGGFFGCFCLFVCFVCFIWGFFVSFFFLFGWFLFLWFFNLVMPGEALFYLAVRESDNLLTNLNSGISLVDLLLFKFK